VVAYRYIVQVGDGRPAPIGVDRFHRPGLRRRCTDPQGSSHDRSNRPSGDSHGGPPWSGKQEMLGRQLRMSA
jgi:hypothetical protein